MNNVLDSIFEKVTASDAIPTMNDITKSAADNVQDAVVEEFESINDLFKKTESPVEAGVQQFYFELDEKTPVQRKELVKALLRVAVRNNANLTVAQAILDASDHDDVMTCAAAALGQVSIMFSSMAPGLLGGLFDSVAHGDDNKGTTERSRIITQDVKAVLPE